MAEHTRPRHRIPGAPGDAPSVTRRSRRDVRQPFDRRELERRGWRTTLDYRENHERDESGVLGAVTAEWRAEGERIDLDGGVIALMSVGPSPAAAWRRLRVAADSAHQPARFRAIS